MTGRRAIHRAFRETCALRWAYGFTFVCDERESGKRRPYEALDSDAKAPLRRIGLEPTDGKALRLPVDKKWSENDSRPILVKPNGNGTSQEPCTRWDFASRFGYAPIDFGIRGTTAERPNRPKNRHPNRTLRNDLIQDPLRRNPIGYDNEARRTLVQAPGRLVDHGADASSSGSNQVNFHPTGSGSTEWKTGKCTICTQCSTISKWRPVHNHTGRRPDDLLRRRLRGIQQYSATWTGDTGGGAKHWRDSSTSHSLDTQTELRHANLGS